MTYEAAENDALLCYFLDESGHPEIFNGKGSSLIGTQGNSRFFMLGKLAVHDPKGLTERLSELRLRLIAEPYFKGVPSFDPARRKTAIQFHAKDDLPEVRREVFKLLTDEGDNLRFYAVVRDKSVLLNELLQQRAKDPKSRYVPEHLYDSLVRELFGKLHRTADSLELCFAQRGNRNRTEAFRKAVEHAEQDFESKFGFRRRVKTVIRSSVPRDDGGLQAVDYYLWALQRFYELRATTSPDGAVSHVREDRYLNLVWPQVGEVHDMDLVLQGRRGVYFSKARPLTLDSRPV